MRQIKVALGDNSYEIRIGAGVLEQTGDELRKLGCGDRLVIITNEVVRKLYGAALKQGLEKSNFTATVLSVPDGEQYKTLETAGKLYNSLSELYAERSTAVLALGGGVIGDLAGFVAATYMRGLPLVHMPTTLLAQVDSSIGGKTAVDFGQIKNKIGAFYQPRLVLSDITALKTLPPREFSNGMAEVIKSAVIGGEDFFGYIEGHLEAIKSRDETALEEIVFRSAQVKASIVEKDEKDTGLRNVLNLGHTTGHAIESASDFAIKHGEAVALGMLAAAKISNKISIFSLENVARLENMIKRVDLPTRLPRLNRQKIMEAVKHDKKAREGRIRFILPRAIGDVFISDVVSLSLVEEVLDEIQRAA